MIITTYGLLYHDTINLSIGWIWCKLEPNELFGAIEPAGQANVGR